MIFRKIKQPEILINKGFLTAFLSIQLQKSGYNIVNQYIQLNTIKIKLEQS